MQSARRLAFDPGLKFIVIKIIIPCWYSTKVLRLYLSVCKLDTIFIFYLL